jgi:hypothetical protein
MGAGPLKIVAPKEHDLPFKQANIAMAHHKKEISQNQILRWGVSAGYKLLRSPISIPKRYRTLPLVWRLCAKKFSSYF